MTKQKLIRINQTLTPEMAQDPDIVELRLRQMRHDISTVVATAVDIKTVGRADGGVDLVSEFYLVARGELRDMLDKAREGLAWSI